MLMASSARGCGPYLGAARLECGLVEHGVDLEALLELVAHVGVGTAPVAASVKREIVRQHLQLHVFEAVPA